MDLRLEPPINSLADGLILGSAGCHCLLHLSLTSFIRSIVFLVTTTLFTVALCVRRILFFVAGENLTGSKRGVVFLMNASDPAVIIRLDHPPMDKMPLLRPISSPSTRERTK